MPLTPDVAALALTAPADGLTVQVVAKEAVADGVCSVTLREPSGRMLPDWTPGSHVDVMLNNGLVRPYSLCGDRAEPFEYRIAVLRDPAGGGGSRYVHDHVEIGDMMAVSAPRNNFALVPAHHYVFIAGGIGITPLVSMIAQADELGADWTLHYLGRSVASMAFADQLAVLGDRVMIRPSEKAGRSNLDALLRDTPAEAFVYCCGPTRMLTHVQEHCADWRPGRLRTERFTPKTGPANVRNTDFAVHLKRTGATVSVKPGVTVIDALAAAGVHVLTSCRQGVCGTCETTVLEGVPDHRDSLLDDTDRARNDCMLPCVSRALSSSLTLDL